MDATDTITRLKQEYVAYYEDVPIQKYAAMAVGRDEDTIIRWRKEDPTFADAVQRAKAGWVRKKLLATKAEFALERLEHEVFSTRAVDEAQLKKSDETAQLLRKVLDEMGDNDVAYPSLAQETAIAPQIHVISLPT